jgi:hypothetical protein
MQLLGTALTTTAKMPACPPVEGIMTKYFYQQIYIYYS